MRLLKHTHPLLWPGIVLAAFIACSRLPTNYMTSTEAVTTEEKAELAAHVRRGVLTVTLRNKSLQSIRVDSELVFLLTIFAIDRSHSSVPLDEVQVLNAPDRRTLDRRLVLLPPGGSVQRTLDLHGPFKQFTCGASFPHGKVTAYEAIYRLPSRRRFRTLHVSYGLPAGGQECLEFYLGKRFPSDLYLGPLACEIQP